MSKKLVAFNGSPRKKGYSSQLLAEAIRGAESEGATVKLYDLNEQNIRACQACYFCRTNEGCALKNDYLAPMYADIKEADSILIASPIYMLDVTGQTKILLDRLFPMVAGVEMTPRYPGKKYGSIIVQGHDDAETFKPQIEKLDYILSSCFGWNLVDRLVCAGTTNPEFEENILRGTLNALKIKVRDELMQRSFDLGKKLIQ